MALEVDSKNKVSSSGESDEKKTVTGNAPSTASKKKGKHTLYNV